MNLIESGHFSMFEPKAFESVVASIRSPHDAWMTAADFRSYIDAQQAVHEAYADKDNWNKMSILNTASSGHFSSDRTIRQYADEIWKI